MRFSDICCGGECVALDSCSCGCVEGKKCCNGNCIPSTDCCESEPTSLNRYNRHLRFVDAMTATINLPHGRRMETDPCCEDPPGECCGSDDPCCGDDDPCCEYLKFICKCLDFALIK